MKKTSLILMLIMALSLLVFPIYATEDENLEDMPTTVDEPSNTVEAEPNMPEIKKETTYFGTVNIFAAYTTLTLDNAAIKNISGGYDLGIDLGLTMIKDLPLALGLRIELIGSGLGNYKGILDTIPTTEYELSTSMIPVMAGASYAFDIPSTPLTIAADLYAGFAFAKAAIASDAINLKTQSFSGSGFVLNIGTTISYQINEPTSAGLILGYRIANMANMSSDSEFIANTVTIPKNTQLKDSDGKVVPFNLSGIILGLKVDMRY
jgi:hypothetical protein